MTAVPPIITQEKDEMLKTKAENVRHNEIRDTQTESTRAGEGSLGLVTTLPLLLIWKGEWTETRHAKLSNEETGNGVTHSTYVKCVERLIN